MGQELDNRREFSQFYQGSSNIAAGHRWPYLPECRLKYLKVKQGQQKGK